MSISSARATHGLTATFTAEAPSVDWREQIGGAPQAVSLPGVTHGYEISATLGGVNDYLTVDMEQGLAAVTGSGTAATGTLTLSGNAVADETVTVGAKTYTWKASVSTTANQVKIGATASDSIDNLIAAINAGAGSGTVYGSATTANAAGTAAAGAGDTLVFTAGAVGTASNSVATTETMTSGSWSAATLTGGVNVSTFTGGDGKDSEGTDIPTQIAVDAVRIRIISGQAWVNGDTIGTPGTFLAGGFFTFGSPGGISSIFGEPLKVTAQQADTVVSVEVLSHIAD